MVFKNLRDEIDTVLRHDPAARSAFEVVLCYPGFHAMLFYRLAHWLWQSGAADLLPSLQDTVWVGVSAGSLVAAPYLGQDKSDWRPPTGSVQALGLVDFSIFPHLDHPNMPGFTLADAERWAAALDGPGYAIDDQTAIRVVDGAVDVVSEGQWTLLNARA